MHLNIDLTIVVGFLIINLCVGMYYGRGITTLNRYALGDRNFSTGTIAATIIATWLAGSSFSITTSEVYNNGLYFFLPGLADALSFFIIAYLYAPRMGEFLGKLSVAEAMGSMYGTPVRTITAISGIIPAIGNIAVQFTILTTLLTHWLGISGIYGIMISSFIVIAYSSFGGIKSVTFTDVIQFSTFGIVLPIVTFLIWKSLIGIDVSFDKLILDPVFDYSKVFDYNNPRFLNTLFLCLFFAIPAIDPAIFQRISMAKNTLQVSRSFIIAGVFVFIVDDGLHSLIGLFFKLSGNSLNLDSTNVVLHVLDTYLSTGFKGLFIIGIMAMIMSTADSYINSSAILFAHDLCEAMKIKLTEQKKLLLVRMASVLIGVIALLISLFFKNLLDLVLSAYSFYMPVVSVPLILAIFGFRSTGKAVLIGMFTGFLTVITFKIFTNIDSLMPGMIANLIFFMSYHYLFKQEGGWVGIKEKAPLEAIRFEQKRKFRNFIKEIKSFSFIQLCKNNNPKEERIYVYFGLFCFVIIFSHAYSLTNSIYQAYGSLFDILYYSVLTIATIFVTYPVWKERFKNEEFMAVFWNIAIIYLVFTNSLIAIISNLSPIQFSILMSTLIVIAVLFRWKSAIFVILSGIYISIKFYGNYLHLDFMSSNFSSTELKIVYSLLLVSSILIAFLKPKEQKEEISEDFKKYLEEKNKLMQLDIIRLSRHKNEFVNRLDKQCISVFRSIYDQLTTLDQELDILGNSSKKSNKEYELIAIIKKLKAGAEYLDEVIQTVNNEVQIKISKINLHQLLHEVIDEYKALQKNKNISISISISTSCEEIEIDKKLIKKLIVTYIEHGIINSIINPNILILAEGARIEYDIEPKNLKIERDAIKLSIIFDTTSITQNDIDNLLCPTIDSINEINFAENYKILSAHYGETNIILNRSGGITYEIILPIKLKEIRPKKLDLIDPEFESINEINCLIKNNTKHVLFEIAIQLIKEGLDATSITRITKLSLEEIKELETQYSSGSNLM